MLRSRDRCQIDSGIYTALGVAAGTRSTIRHVFGDGSLSGRTILVQGVGVGGHLAQILTRAGATVLISDINRMLVDQLREKMDCGVVPPEMVYETPCDVYAPCALGGTLNQQSLPRLKCKIVAGAANNQLQEPEIADLLHGRGILYAPDYVINAGGAIALPMFYDGAKEKDVRARVTEIGRTLTQILNEAKDSDESPLHVARRQAIDAEPPLR